MGWIDDAPKVGPYTIKCPVTKRYRPGHWNDNNEYITAANVPGQIKKFQNMENEDKWERTLPTMNHRNTKKDVYREVTVTKYWVLKNPPFRNKSW